MCKMLLTNVWTCFCILITIGASTWQLYNYLYGDDLTTISYKYFHQTAKDIYPSIGFCFFNTLIEEKLNNYPIRDVNGSNCGGGNLKYGYSHFLMGDCWDQDMLLIDYFNV